MSNSLPSPDRIQTLLIRPEKPLSRAELDGWLHRGYRSTGQCLYYSDFLRAEDDTLHGVIQTRLPLAGHEFKRKQRRLLRQNGDIFTVKVGPVRTLTPDFYAVNERYKTLHPDKTITTLWAYVDDGFGSQVLPTHAVEVFHQGVLVAFSFFDPGLRHVYSKTGVYDPRFAHYSLGNYTLLLEIEWAKAQGLEYYHPGYYAPTWPVFNYKLRLGPMEFKDCRDGAWKPMPGNDPHYPPDPVAVVRAAMAEAAKAAERRCLAVNVFEYPGFTARYFHEGDGGNLLDTPLFIRPVGVPDRWPDRLLSYNFHAGRYEVLNYVLSDLRDTRLQTVPDEAVNRFPHPIEVLSVVDASENADEMLRLLK